MKTVLILAALALAVPANAQLTIPVEQLNHQDLRLATLAERMFSANATLCLQQMPLTGMILHSRDQYATAEAQARFGAGAIGVAMVLPGSPAERAGIRPGDLITAIGAVDVASLQPADDDLLRDAAFALIADGGSVTFDRQGETFSPPIIAPAGCRGLVEIRSSGDDGARTNGRIIQLDYGLAAAVNDAALAVVFAHELAHLVLDHRRRLQAAGVSKGFLAEFGRNGRLNRQMEEEADLLSVHLLANSGFDPMIAPRFWRSRQGQEMAGGLLRSRVHPSANARADALEREIAEHLQMGAPSGAAHLLMLRNN